MSARVWKGCVHEQFVCAQAWVCMGVGGVCVHVCGRGVCVSMGVGGVCVQEHCVCTSMGVGGVSAWV